MTIAEDDARRWIAGNAFKKIGSNSKSLIYEMRVKTSQSIGRKETEASDEDCGILLLRELENDVSYASHGEKEVVALQAEVKGDYNDAEKMLHTVLKWRTEKQGKKHPETRFTFDAYVLVLGKREEYKKSGEKNRRRVDMLEKGESGH